MIDDVLGRVILAVGRRQLGVLGEAMFSIIAILTPPVLTALLRRSKD